jgi:hypothetical protein
MKDLRGLDGTVSRRSNDAEERTESPDPERKIFWNTPSEDA